MKLENYQSLIALLMLIGTRYIYLLSDACINCRYMKGIKKMKQFTISQKIYMGVKRVIDILLSALALILLSWLFLILCIAIKIDSRGPILFKQKRVGSIRHTL